MEQRVSRKIYFFRLADYNEYHPLLEEAFAYIDDLPFNDNGRYLPTSDDDNVLAVFVTSAVYPIKAQFGKIRRANLPLVEKGGEITPLNLSDDEGIMDWGHIVIFSDGIIAAEFNQDAPRISRLGQYLSFKSGGILPSSPRFLPLYQRAVLEELEAFDTVSILEIEALTTDAELIAEGDKHIGAAFKACRQAGNVKKSRIILKSLKNGESDLKNVARRLFNTASSRESLTHLKATGKSGKQRKPLDMLEEYLISTDDFIKLDSRSKALSPNHAFAVIERAYKRNQGRFAGAATANMSW